MEDPILLEISAEIDLVFDSMSRIAMRDREGWMLQSFKPNLELAYNLRPIL
jgi:hypothetical protein